MSIASPQHSQWQNSQLSNKKAPSKIDTSTVMLLYGIKIIKIYPHVPAIRITTQVPVLGPQREFQHEHSLDSEREV